MFISVLSICEKSEKMEKNKIHNNLKEFVKRNNWIYSIYSFIGSLILNLLSLFLKKESLIFVISYGGVKIDDSPQVLLDALLKDPEFNEYKFVVASSEEVFLTSKYYKNERVIHVRPDTFKYYYFLLKSKIWITNTSVKRGLYFKARDTIYINTWHGTALKKIGYDIANDIAFKSKEVYSDISYFSVQSDYDKAIFKRAFGLNDEQLLLSGLPRNDALLNYGKKDIEDIKRKLGIPEDKKVIIYAPTYRDYTESKSAYIDVSQFMENLDKDYYFLYRAHHSMDLEIGENLFDNFIDVSSYPLLYELLLVSDVLISDYSSISIDYSILKRPIFLYINDLEEYELKRGLYIDLKKEFSEHVFIDQAEILKALNDKNIDKYKPKKLRDKFIQVEGMATKVIVDRIKKELRQC